MTTRRIRNRKMPPTAARTKSAAAYRRVFSNVTPAARSSTACLSTHGLASEIAVVRTAQMKPIRKLRRYGVRYPSRRRVGDDTVQYKGARCEVRRCEVR